MNIHKLEKFLSEHNQPKFRMEQIQESLVSGRYFQLGGNFHAFQGPAGNIGERIKNSLFCCGKSIGGQR